MRAGAGRRWRDAWADRRGSLVVTVALMLPVMIAAGALALDFGTIYLEHRSLQAACDASALAAASHPADAAALSRRLFAAQGHGDAAVTLTAGTIDPLPATDRDLRFRPGGPGGSVRVAAAKPARLYFGRIFRIDPPVMSVRCDASVEPVVSLSAGSRLASADPALVNALVGPTLGTHVDLALVDYRGLARSSLGLGGLLVALDADRPAGDAVSTVGAVLARRVRVGDLFAVLSVELARSGDRVGAAALRDLGRRLATSQASVALGDMIAVDEALGRLDVDYPGHALGARLSALGLVSAVLADRAGGHRLEASLLLPGLAEVSLEARLGKAMQSVRPMAAGDGGPAVATAQLRLRARVATKGLLDGIGAGIDLPVELVAAGGSARVVSATCGPAPADREVRVEVRPGLARLSIGRWTLPLGSVGMTDRLDPAEIVSAPLLKVAAAATLAVRRDDPLVLRFGAAEIGNGTVKTARTAGIARSLVGSLLGETELVARPLGVLPIPASLLKRTVSGSLQVLAAPLDALLDRTLDALGVGLGEMDVRVDDLVCSRARLVG